MYHHHYHTHTFSPHIYRKNQVDPQALRCYVLSVKKTQPHQQHSSLISATTYLYTNKTVAFAHNLNYSELALIQMIKIRICIACIFTRVCVCLRVMLLVAFICVPVRTSARSSIAASASPHISSHIRQHNVYTIQPAPPHVQPFNSAYKISKKNNLSSICFSERTSFALNQV